MSLWDDPDIAAGGDFVDFKNIGDSASGVVKVVRKHVFDDGKVAPQLLLICDDGEERTVTAGQIRLKIALTEQRPEAGDHVSITLTSIEPRSGGKTLKHFDVKVTRGGAPAATAAPATPAAAPADNPLAGLTPEQLAALAALQKA